MRVAVQEKAGNSIKHIAKAEPLRSVGCDREDCFVCTTGEGGKCQKNGSGYRIQCLTCQRDGVSTLYEGETARNAYTRGLEHADAIRLKDEENALWKHCLMKHGGVEAEFSMEVTGVHRTPLVRQVNEAVRIVIMNADCVMNSKSEWHQAPLVRIIPVSGLTEDQGEGRASLEQEVVAGGRGGRGRGAGGRGRGAGGRSGRRRRW